MKRCPSCQSTYTDDSLTFCLTDGAVQNKEQLLATLKPAPMIASLKLDDLKISLAGGTVVLTGLNTATSTRGQVLKFRFTDTFLWRDGRWQAISSQASQVK
jgi:hypothetical protein